MSTAMEALTREHIVRPQSQLPEVKQIIKKNHFWKIEQILETGKVVVIFQGALGLNINR